MKYTLLLTFILTLNISFAQKQEGLSVNDWDKIVKLLSTEKWKDAEKLAIKYMEKVGDDDSLADPAILRYMYLRCVAAQLGEKTYDKATALKKVEGMTGKSIITPPLLFNPDKMFNGLQLSEDSNSFFSCASNNSMTVIQEFEEYNFADTTVVDNTRPLLNKSLRIAGFIKSIEAEGMTMPRFRVVFENAFIWDEQ